MSYLCGPRLAFRGRFLADVPTRNNAGPAYDPGQPVVDRWNPVGGGPSRTSRRTRHRCAGPRPGPNCGKEPLALSQ